MNATAKHTLIKISVTLAAFVLGFLGVFSVVKAGESKSPKTLVYSGGSLKWDSKTKVNKEGAVILDLFDTNYGNSIVSSNGDKIIAPGTSGKDSVTLKNSSSSNITYLAYIYKTYTKTLIPVDISFAENLKSTDTYPLTDDITDDSVVRAVSGILEAGKSLDFNISWVWDFEDNTFLETMNDFDEAVGIGLYFEVEDPGGKVTPSTGDINSSWIIFTVCIAAAILLIISAAIYLKKESE